MDLTKLCGFANQARRSGTRGFQPAKEQRHAGKQVSQRIPSTICQMLRKVSETRPRVVGLQLLLALLAAGAPSAVDIQACTQLSSRKFSVV